MIAIFQLLFLFFFKQKTAYEMRISDWSSDVCSSDLFEEAMNDSGLIGMAASPTTADESDVNQLNRFLLTKVDELELSVRSANGLTNDNIIYIGDLVQKTERSEERRVGQDSVRTGRFRM